MIMRSAHAEMFSIWAEGFQWQLEYFGQSSWYRDKTKKEVDIGSRDNRVGKQKEAKENQMLQMPLSNAKSIRSSSAPSFIAAIS